MDIIGYIVDNALILIPALIVVGAIIKQVEAIPNKWIPLILLPLGIAGALALGGLVLWLIGRTGGSLWLLPAAFGLLAAALRELHGRKADFL